MLAPSQRCGAGAGRAGGGGRSESRGPVPPSLCGQRLLPALRAAGRAAVPLELGKKAVGNESLSERIPSFSVPALRFCVILSEESLPFGAFCPLFPGGIRFPVVVKERDSE